MVDVPPASFIRVINLQTKGERSEWILHDYIKTAIIPHINSVYQLCCLYITNQIVPAKVHASANEDASLKSIHKSKIV